MRYHNMLFDLDRTLWDFNSNSKDSLLEMAGQFGLSDRIPSPGHFYRSYVANNLRLWEMYEQGLITQTRLRSLRFEQTLNEYGVFDPDLAVEMGRRYLELLSQKKKLMPHALEVLDYLKANQIGLAIITNGFRDVQYNKIEHSGLAPYFSQIIISDTVGYHKPHPRIFKAALSALNAKKKQTLMVGDDLAKDIEGARLYGIDQYYYYQGEDPGPTGATYQGADLRELKALAYFPHLR